VGHCVSRRSVDLSSNPRFPDVGEPWRTPILFRNHLYIVGGCQVLIRLSPANSQPHEARFFSRVSMRSIHCSPFGSSHMSTLCLLPCSPPPLSSPGTYNAAFTLNLQKWTPHTSCQCVHYQDKNRARVRNHPGDVVTDPKYGHSNGGYEVNRTCALF
jgi:hypothetical protein